MRFLRALPTVPKNCGGATIVWPVDVVVLLLFENTAGLKYWICDATEFEQGIGTHDIVYLSGCTPDEARRSAIVKDGRDSI